MLIRKVSQWLLGTLFSLFCLGQAGAVAIGPNLPRDLLTIHPFIANLPGPGVIPGWCVAIDCIPAGGVEPYTITADPEAGVWIKALLIPGQNPVPFGAEALVLELLQVGTGPDWRDWHEAILTPGWNWLGAVLLTGEFDEGLDSFAPAVGLDVSFSPGRRVVWFDFDPLPPGTEILVAKQIHCRNDDGCSPDRILIAEYPSIPEPATLALLGLGLAGLGFSRRRKR